MKTLKEFLIKNYADQLSFRFAKDLKLEEFLKTCDDASFILWLFKRINPYSIRELILVKGLCANTVRYLMKDERSIKAVDTAIAFGKYFATKEELDKAKREAWKAIIESKKPAVDEEKAVWAAAAMALEASAAWAVPDVTCGAAAMAAAAKEKASIYNKTYKDHLKLMADICRENLPLEIWDQSKL